MLVIYVGMRSPSPSGEEGKVRVQTSSGKLAFLVKGSMEPASEIRNIW